SLKVINMTYVIVLPSARDAVDRYLAGASLNQLSKEFGIGRGPLGRILRQEGVKLRGKSDAELVKWKRLKRDPDAVTRQCGKAWSARRGQHDPPERLAARALTQSRRVGRFEDELRELVIGLGVPLSGQVCVGPYNLDIASEPLRFAVEVIGCGSGEKGTARLRERTKYLLGCGWRVVFVPLRTRPQRLDPGLQAIAENLVSLAQEPSRDESSWCKYGVVGRHGKPTAFCRRELDGLPRIHRA